MADQGSDSLYLSKLTFDPKLNGSFFDRWIGNVRLLMLVLLGLIITGVVSFITLPRELNPEVNIPIVSITTALPGANPTDVEELLTDPIEKEISSIANINQYTSSSQEGLSIVSVEFVSTVDPDEALREVKEKVDLVTDLPEDATTPRVNKLDFNDQPVWQVALVSELDPYSLTKIAEEVQTQLETVTDIRRVDLGGAQEDEIVIQLDQQVLVEYGLTASEIRQTIQGANINLPAGSLAVNQLDYQVSVDNGFASIEELRQLPIRSSRGEVRLGEVASVTLQAKETSNLAWYQGQGQSQQNAIDLNIYKTNRATIFGAVEAAEEQLITALEQYPQVEYVSVINVADDVSESFAELNNNVATTILLVFLTLFVFLGLRQALIASISIPLTFLSAFVVMRVTGISLNFLSLFSLLIALGLVVDDAIVIVQASYRYSQKFNPRQTGLMVFKDFVVPIWTTTITTVWAFVPLLLSTGIIGEFIKSIPIVVAATLLSSTTIAVLINLPLTVVLAELKIPKRVIGLALGILLLVSLAGWWQFGSSASPLLAAALVLTWVVFLMLIWWSRQSWRRVLGRSYGAVSKKIDLQKKIPSRFLPQQVLATGAIDFSGVTAKYQKLLKVILKSTLYRRSVYVVVTSFFVVSVGFLMSGLLKNEFFPQTDVEEIFVNFEGPAGWQLAALEPYLTQVQELAVAHPEVAQVFVSTGSKSPYTTNFGSSLGGNNVANMTLVLIDEAERSKTSSQIAQELRTEIEPITSIAITVEEQSGGPPAGADLQVNILGNDLLELEELSNIFTQRLADISGATNIDTSLKQSSGQIAVELNQAALQQRGLSAIEVGSWLRTAVTGSETGSISLGGDDVDIVLRLSEDAQSLDFLQNIVLPSRLGSYTLAEVAEFRLQTSPLEVSHQDGERVVTVTATADGVSAPELLEEFESAVADVELEPGYSWDVGGVNEENNRSVQSIIQAMGIAVLLILVTMVLQLGSFRQALIVLLVIPLAVAGVFFNFTLVGIPLSFPALIGVLALFGIVVNNSIMLVEKINQNIKTGLKFLDAVVDACASRVEAIFFTSLTTTVGLLPITISDPLWRGLGGAIIAGLTVSGLLILFLLPSLYVDFFQAEHQFSKTARPAKKTG